LFLSTRHVAFHAGAAAAADSVVRVRLHRLADGRVAMRAESVRIGAKLWILLDLGLMRVGVAGDAGGAAFEETFALPQSERVV
jgi:hypothetical protein